MISVFEQNYTDCETGHEYRNAPYYTFYYMKLTTLSAVIALTLIAGSSHAKSHHPVSVLAVRNDLFYFKVDRAMIGATVEVYSPEGELVFTWPIKRHKMLIDFIDKNEGDYTIRIRSKCSEFEFQYTKFDPAGIDAFKPMVKRIL
jgi:hypothetical protein